MEIETYKKAKYINEQVDAANFQLSQLKKLNTIRKDDKKWKDLLSIAYDAVKFKRDVYLNDFKNL